RELGMKGQRQPVALSQRHRPSGMDRQDLRLAGRLHHLGGADEYRWAAAPDGWRFHLRLEAVDLAAVGVALHGHVDQAQRLLVRAPVHDPVRHQDHAGAGSEHRHALGAAGYDRLPQAGLHQPRHGGALTARMSGRSKYVVAATIALARADGFSDLKIPDPTKTPSQPSCIIRAASAGVASPPAAKLTTGRRPSRAQSSSRSTGAPIRLASMTSS